MNRNPARSLNTAAAMLALLVCQSVLRAQQAADGPKSPVATVTAADLDRHLDQLTSELEKMEQKLEESQNEVTQLRTELGSMRAQLAEKNQSELATKDADALRASVAQLQDQTEVLQAEVKLHDQTKVESGLKYPVRISGTLLFTSLLNSGTPDDIDLPIVAEPQQQGKPSGSLSASVRQTVVDIALNGSHLWGATGTGSVSLDFNGGMPYADYNTAAGLVRLRTLYAGLEWPGRSITAVFSRPLISPWEPTSWVSVGEPAMAWSGNLWAWSPQLQFKENNILRNRQLSLEVALIDPAAPSVNAANVPRAPDAAEQSRQPGFEMRLSPAFDWRGRRIQLGAGGYYSRQAYSNGRHIDAWAGSADWKVPLTSSLEFSGDIYRGRAIGGLGGGTFKDYVTYDNYSILRGLDAEGGWAQLKIAMSNMLETNLAIGQDDAMANDLYGSDLLTEQSSYLNLARNQTMFGNLVFHSRSFLLFSAELRQLKSWPIAGLPNRDRILGIATGYSF